MATSAHLLIIDAQNDFCDLPAAWCPLDGATGQRLGPALPVPGAHADMLRLAGLIEQAGHRLDAITASLDSHHRVDIAHPPFWRTADGGAVAPFTPISAAQVRSGAFVPRDAALLGAAQAYVDALEARQRYTLMVWPVHCQIGSWGHGLHPAVLAACSAWEDRRLRPVQLVSKGEHTLTEHYSALEAEVPDPAVAATLLNASLLQRLAQADTLLVAGQAASHCVGATLRHLVEHLPAGHARRLVLLGDCTSPVAGFEAAAAELVSDMTAQGVRCCTAAEWLATAA